jgi:diguanylate cyclase (GGDEF)-like protein
MTELYDQAIVSVVGFESAAREVMRFLRRRLGFNLWMVTRTDGVDWIVLQAEDNGYYGVKDGASFRWADSFCSRMIAGEGPRIAPSSRVVAVYETAPIASKLAISAYVGVPLHNPDGSLFGTLCAIDPDPQPPEIANDLALIELLASMLSGLLACELRAIDAEREAERATGEAETDAMTGLFNRRGWNRLIAMEDARCRRYGQQACIFAIDIDGLKGVNDTLGHPAGDDLICRAAKALRSATRESDTVARVGGDEFAVLCVECGAEMLRNLHLRIRAALDYAKVSASIGMATLFPINRNLEGAWHNADEQMYVDKSLRGARR